MNISVDPVWSWPAVVLCCAGLVSVLLAGYRGQIRHLPQRRRRLLTGLRLAVTALLMLLMLRPSVRLTHEDRSDSVIYVLSDVSRSMRTRDAVSGLSRFEHQQKVLSQAQRSLERLRDAVDIRYRVYSDTLQVPSDEPPQPDGAVTSIANALEGVLDDIGGAGQAVVILLGDGRQAAVGRDARDPVPLARRLGRDNVPVYTTVFGSSSVASAGVDAAVTELDVPPDVFVRNEVPLSVRLKAVGAAGRQLRVRVFLEAPRERQDASGTMQPVPPDSRNRSQVDITADSDNFDQLVDLSFVPPRPGDWKVAVHVDVLEDEARPTNNRVETIIRVRQGGIRVVYFDRLRPEVKFLRSITVSDRVQLDFQPLFTGRFQDRNRFDESWFTPGQVDAYLIGDVPAEVFGADRLKKIEQCCRFGAGLMMIGGSSNYGAGGYQKHSISRLLPVDVEATVEQLTGEVRMLPTAQGLRHSVMQIAPPEVNRQRWEELPPLGGATRLQLRKEASLAQVLAETPEGTPLLVAQDTGRSRVMAFAGDTTWHWAVQAANGREIAGRFWRQVILWITRKDQDTDGPVWLEASPRDTTSGRPVELRFGARDDSGQPVTDADFRLTITGPDGTARTVEGSRDGDHFTAEFTDTQLAGDYWVRMEAAFQGQRHQTMTRFLVNARDPELDNPSADPEMMKNLAWHSGGDSLTPEQLLERLENWAVGGMPGLQMERSTRVNLWDNWYILLLFSGLLTAEWALRKKSGLV